MPSIRAAVLVTAVCLAGPAACERPNLDSTEGGYGQRATSAAEADTGAIAPHEGPAPVDTGTADTGAGAER